MLKPYVVTIAVGLISFFAFSGYLQKKELPDFSAIDNVQTKKKIFFKYLSPLVEAENKRIRQQRDKLISLWRKHQHNGRLTRLERKWLKKLTQRYELMSDGKKAVPWLQLKKRVDTIPRSLALVQAAVESAWGTSRFARQGNNLFGEHCVTDGCGIPPKGLDDAAFEVETFDAVAQSVRSYMHNLNTHPAYETFRKKRHAFRRRGEKPDAHELAEALHPYSERDQEYTRNLQAMLNQNQKLIQTL